MTRPKKGFRRVLVVTKESLLEREADQIPDAMRASLLRRDLENRQSIYDVFHALGRSRVPFEIIGRNEVRFSERFDLVISVGGDGTFLAASHVVGADVPMLGVNSDPAASVALFCACDRRSFERTFGLAQSGRLPETRLNRLRLELAGREIPVPVLNDVLYTHRNPASMTRYRLAVDGRIEEQRSSGLWISSAAGSTAGIYSAGGRRMPIGSTRIQVRVREPFTALGRARMTAVSARRSVEVTSWSTGAMIFVDGTGPAFEIPPGGRVSVSTPGTPLRVLGYREGRRRRLFQDPAHR